MSVVLIVGASSGLGAACAFKFAHAGMTIVGAARRWERVATAISQLPAADPSHLAVPLDVQSCVQIETVCRDLVARELVPDIVLYTAGVNRFGPLAEIGADAWDEAYAVNVRGAYLLCRELAPNLRRGAKILLVGSTAALDPFEEGTAYCSSKAALHALAVVLRRELSQRDIGVTLVVPGSMNTEFWKTPRSDAASLLDSGSVADLILALTRMPPAAITTDVVIRPPQEL